MKLIPVVDGDQEIKLKFARFHLSYEGKRAKARVSGINDGVSLTNPVSRSYP